LLAQMVGVATNFVWVGGSSLVFFWIIGKLVGNRTTAKAEIDGLDIEPPICAAQLCLVQDRRPCTRDRP